VHERSTMVNQLVPRILQAPKLLACIVMDSRTFDTNIVFFLEVAAIVKALHQHLWGAHDYSVHCTVLGQPRLMG